MSEATYSSIFKKIKTSIKPLKNEALMGLETCCKVLRNNIAYYDWVGFYFSNFDTKKLKLKAFLEIRQNILDTFWKRNMWSGCID